MNKTNRVQGGGVPVQGGRVPVQGGKGQSLIETALTLPILVMLLLVCVEGGRLILAKMAIERLARETAELAGSVGTPTSEVSDYLKEQIEAEGSLIGEEWKAKLAVFDRTGSGECHVMLPASRDCQANYGDWVEIRVRVEISTFFGTVIVNASHRASAWRAFVP